ncbi:MAG: TAXI family TRAP transporter solute-binding subunit [Rhizobiales bacterium]|nr:TAXI family TRAP transporter solute-binding subunit [Hyphomicrobiales bacterium]
MRFLRLAAIAVTTLLVATSAHAQTISIGTSPVGSLNYSLGNALGKVMTEQGGLRARVVPFGGGQQFLPLIGKNELELAIPSASDSIFALQGKAAFEGSPTPDLRAIGTVFPYYVGFFVKKDSPYKSLSDLKGKKFPVGFTANSAQRRIYLAGLASEGLKESDFDGVAVPHVVRAADDFAQGKVEATTFAIGGGKVAEVDAKLGGVRFLNMPNTPKALAGIKEFMPTTYIDVVNPAPQFAGVVAPTSVMFEDYLVLAGKQLSDDAAYKIAKVLYEHQDKLEAIAKPFGRYDKAELARSHGITFHPGAIKYYREKGIWKDN